MEKKGQGLSLTTIIIATLALLVLVVLVAILTGNIGGKFVPGVEKAGEENLVMMRITYGTCQPTTTEEELFLTNLGAANEDSALEESATKDFNLLIKECKAMAADTCGGRCIWKD